MSEENIPPALIEEARRRVRRMMGIEAPPGSIYVAEMVAAMVWARRYYRLNRLRS